MQQRVTCNLPLSQAGYVWCKEIRNKYFMKKLGFTASEADPCLRRKEMYARLPGEEGSNAKADVSETTTTQKGKLIQVPCPEGMEKTYIEALICE